MRGRTIIRPDGTSVTEVLDREGENCSQVTKITERIGRQTGEEITGPDCDTVQEGTFNEGQ